MGESETEFESQDVETILKKKGKYIYRRVKVFDRFSIILQIFAQRSNWMLNQRQQNCQNFKYN